jgi:hypothetical protein
MAYTTGNITITNPGAVSGTTYTIGAGGGGYQTASVTIPNGGYTLATSGNPIWTTASAGYASANMSNKVNIHSNGIDLDDGTDIKMGSVSLKETLEKLHERLAILVPDPKKLEKYEALKQAYEHYKTLEALCTEPDKEEPK